MMAAIALVALGLTVARVVVFPPDLLRVGGSVFMIVALLANTAAFRPAAGSTRAGGPLPMWQAERMLHVLATLVPFVIMLKMSGVVGA
ncbi:MAG: hypothetical protein AB7S36_08290 [Planctomycetota bacterium]